MNRDILELKVQRFGKDALCQNMLAPVTINEFLEAKIPCRHHRRRIHSDEPNTLIKTVAGLSSWALCTLSAMSSTRTCVAFL